MSEILENENVIIDDTEKNQAQNSNLNNVNSIDDKQPDETVNDKTDEIQEACTTDDIKDFLKDFFDKKSEIDKELEAKREYLATNLIKYDTDDYFGNDSFKELYTEAFNSLGTNLDTEKFVRLLDNYVNSRIEKHSKNLSAKNENDGLTDSFSFDAGVKKLPEKKLRMQDIPVNELEKYIAKYI